MRSAVNAGTRPNSSVLLPRCTLSLLLGSMVFFPRIYQHYLHSVYTYLLNNSFYKASTFETIWTVIWYIIIEIFHILRFVHNPQLRLSVQKSGSATKPLPKLRRPKNRLNEGLIYITPLLTMDLIMIKKFAGVPVQEMAMSGNYDLSTVSMRGTFLAPTFHNFTFNSPLQTQRALPQDSPSSRQVILQLATSILLYDTLFFFFHLALHKLPLLNRFHSVHHQHGEINPQITNQLDIVERLGLVLLANFSLNIIGSHVLTRTLFVPMFVWLLVDIHSGMDQEWAYDKLLPRGWAAGSRRHSYHHQHGTMYYAPFFNWWDNGLAWIQRRRLISRNRGPLSTVR